MIADEIARGLASRGAIVVGPAPSVDKALSLIAAEPDLDGAILDLNLGGEKSWPVAAALEARRVPFLFATGYSAADIPQQWQHVRCAEKPLEISRAARLLAPGTC